MGLAGLSPVGYKEIAARHSWPRSQPESQIPYRQVPVDVAARRVCRRLRGRMTVFMRDRPLADWINRTPANAPWTLENATACALAALWDRSGGTEPARWIPLRHDCSSRIRGRWGRTRPDAGDDANATACALPSIAPGQQRTRWGRGPDRTPSMAWRFRSSGHRLGAFLGASARNRSRT